MDFCEGTYLYPPITHIDYLFKQQRRPFFCLYHISA